MLNFNRLQRLCPRRGVAYRQRRCIATTPAETIIAQSVSRYSVRGGYRVVYAKLPFGGPKQVIEYLGHYTHKIALSNHRITSITDHAVTFRYKDYRDESKNKVMSLTAQEFIRRFSLNILPKGFPRIRHYGILSIKRKKKILPMIH